MKVFLLIALIFQNFFAWAEVEPDLDILNDRFVSTIKDVDVENKIQNSAELKKCKSDPNPALCFKSEIAKKSDEELKELSNQLQLDDFGVIRGKGPESFRDYLTSRFNTALRGYDPERQPNKKFSEQKQVDHQTFIELYDSQLAKNVLFEITNYCYNHLDFKNPSATNTFIDNWKLVISNIEQQKNNKQFNLTSLFNEVDKSKEAEKQIKNSGEIYSKYVPSNMQSAANVYKQIFGTCTIAIRLFCEEYQEELSNYRKNNNGSVFNCDVQGAKANPDCQGYIACNVQSKLKAFRANIQALQQTKKEYETMRGGVGVNTGTQFYNSKTAGENSIDSLTTISSKDEVDAAMETTKAESDEFNNQGCSTNPDKPECYKFFYNKADEDKRKKMQLAYDAQTETELLRKQKLIDQYIKENKPQDLKKFLTDNGYGSIAIRLGKKEIKESDVAGEIEKIYLAERTAMMDELKRAFENKTITGNKTKDAVKAGTAEKDLKESKNQLQSVILFNNLITGYLPLQNTQTKKESLNLTPLMKEFAIIDGKQSELGATFQYFSDLKEDVNSNSGSSDNADGNVIVDLNQIDSWLGNN
jgi:hypothetical protein